MTHYQIEPLDHATHAGPFSSGDLALDRYFDRIATWAETTGDARVFVLTSDTGRVAAFYTLSAAALDYDEAPEPLKKGAAKNRPMPAVLLGRFAVDQEHQGSGFGRRLLDDAITRASIAARSLGVRALIVDAKDESAMVWYLKRAPFLQSPLRPHRLILPVQEIHVARKAATIDAAPGDQIRGRLLATLPDGRASAESMWFEVAGDDTFIVRNLPTLVDNVAFGDVVRIVPSATSGHVVTEIIARGGYANVLLSFADNVDPDHQTALLTRWSLDWGVIFERMAGPMGGAAVPWRRFDAFVEDLERGDASRLVRTSYVSCGVAMPLQSLPSIEAPR